MISVANNNDGTVAVSIFGVSGSATVTVYYARHTGSDEAVAWTVGGTVTGPADFVLTLTTGRYQFTYTTLLSGTTALGRTAYQSCTNDEDPLYLRILDSVADQIVALQLECLPAEKVKRVWVPRHNTDGSEGGLLPKAMVAPLGLEQDVSELMQTDDIRYPVVVVLVEKQDGDQSRNMKKCLMWRELIAKKFRNKRLAGVPESYTVEISYDVAADITALVKGVLLSALILNVKCRETRGV